MNEIWGLRCLAAKAIPERVLVNLITVSCRNRRCMGVMRRFAPGLAPLATVAPDKSKGSPHFQKAALLNEFLLFLCAFRNLYAFCD